MDILYLSLSTTMRKLDSSRIQMQLLVLISEGVFLTPSLTASLRNTSKKGLQQSSSVHAFYHTALVGCIVRRLHYVAHVNTALIQLTFRVHRPLSRPILGTHPTNNSKDRGRVRQPRSRISSGSANGLKDCSPFPYAPGHSKAPLPVEQHQRCLASYG